MPGVWCQRRLLARLRFDGQAPQSWLHRQADHLIVICRAIISFVDQKGDQMLVKAVLWRSGAVCSAVQAGVPAQDIQRLDWWTSKDYLLQAPLNLQDEACSMWADTSLRMAPATSGLLVAEFDVSGFFAPRIACDINSMLSKLGIDVNDPTPK